MWHAAQMRMTLIVLALVITGNACALTGHAAGSTADRDASVTVLVDGMFKSRSGAT